MSMTITDFTLLSVATIDPDTYTINEATEQRAYTVKQRVLNNDCLLYTSDAADE